MPNRHLFAVSSLAAAVIVSIPAYAADMPVYAPPPAPIAPQPVHDWWTGPYVGVHVGYGWSDHDFTALPDNDVPALFTGEVPTHLSLDATSLLGGVQAGYNFRVEQIVFGVEGDFSWTGLSDRTVFGDYPATTATEGGAGAKVNWLATLRGRIGVLLSEEALLYATGGLAAGRLSYDWHVVAPDLDEGYFGAKRDTKWGWTLGGGLEWALDENWSVKGEYLYYDFGSTSFLAPGDNAPGAYHVSADTQIHTVRLGLNYRFGHPRRDDPVIARY